MQSIQANSISIRLVSVNSIRDRVHMAPANVGIRLLQVDVLQKIEVNDYSNECNDLTKGRFYLNRFFRHEDRAYHFIDEDRKNSF